MILRAQQRDHAEGIVALQILSALEDLLFGDGLGLVAIETVKVDFLEEGPED